MSSYRNLDNWSLDPSLCIILLHETRSLEMVPVRTAGDTVLYPLTIIILNKILFKMVLPIAENCWSSLGPDGTWRAVCLSSCPGSWSRPFCSSSCHRLTWHWTQEKWWDPVGAAMIIHWRNFLKRSIMMSWGGHVKAVDVVPEVDKG